jgi:hypothetical protein
LVLTQSEHVTRNLVNSLTVAPRHQAATWLLAVFAAKQQPAGLFSVWRSAAYVCHNLLNLSMDGCELSNLGLRHRDQRGGSCAPHGCSALFRGSSRLRVPCLGLLPAVVLPFRLPLYSASGNKPRLTNGVAVADDPRRAGEGQVGANGLRSLAIAHLSLLRL